MQTNFWLWLDNLAPNFFPCIVITNFSPNLIGIPAYFKRGGNMSKLTTTASAGRKGGRTTARTHKKEFYQSIGKQGGSATKDEYGSDFYKLIGQKGGLARKKMLGESGYKQLGRKGGNATKRNFGPSHYSKIGKIGGHARSNKK